MVSWDYSTPPEEERVLNVPLLRKTMEHVEHLPQHIPMVLFAAPEDMGDAWDQSLWLTRVRRAAGEACGTAGCFAGWTAVLDGAEVASYDDATVYVPDDWTGPSFHNEERRRVTTVSGYAAHVLGLYPHQVSHLFRADNSITQLRQVVEEYIAEAEEV